MNAARVTRFELALLFELLDPHPAAPTAAAAHATSVAAIPPILDPDTYRSPGSWRGNCDTGGPWLSAVSRIRSCSSAWAIGYPSPGDARSGRPMNPKWS